MQCFIFPRTPAGHSQTSREVESSSNHITKHALFLGEYKVSYLWICLCETELCAAPWWPQHKQSSTVRYYMQGSEHI